MIKHKDQRVGVFVDIQNMYYSARFLYGRHVNFGKILEESVADRKLIRAIAYVIRTQTPEENTFFEALSKQGFEVKMKELQVFSSGQKKGDWDVGLAVDAIRLSSKLDVIVLVSGDGDYLPLVEYLQNHGHLVEVVAFGESCSMRLKEAVDHFTDLSQDSSKYLLAQKGAAKKWNPLNEAANHAGPMNGSPPENQPPNSQPPPPPSRRRSFLPFLDDRKDRR